MLELRGFSAWISYSDDGIPVPEYLPTASKDRASCWIPSVQGQKFTVHWRDHDSGIDSAAFIILDGMTIPGRFLFGEGEASRSGVRTGASTERPLVFADVREGVDDDPTSTTPKDIGTITLKIKRVIRTVTRPANTPLSIPTYRRTIDAASQHRVGFGPERSTTEQYPQTWGCKPYDAKHPESYVKFIFRYRSRDFLISQGIMSDRVTSVSVTGSLKATQWDRMNPSMKQAFSPTVALQSKRAIFDKAKNSRPKIRRPAHYPGESYITFDNDSDTEGVKSDQPIQMSFTSPQDVKRPPDRIPDATASNFEEIL